MSASTATRSNVTTIESTSRKLRFQPFNFVAASGVLLIALVAIGFATVIAFNFGEWSPSFWLGVASLVVVGAPFYVLWITHHMKNQALGYILSILTFVVVGVILGLFFNFTTSFVWSKFGWGVLFVLLIVVVYAAIVLFGSLLSRRVAASNR